MKQTVSTNKIAINIQDITPTMIVCVDRLTQAIVYSNKQFRHKLAYSERELEDTNIYSFVTRGDLIIFADAISGIDIRDDALESEVTLINKNGKLLDCVLHCSKHESDADVIYLFFTDNTKQKAKNKSLDVFRQIFSSTKELMSLVGKDMTYVEVNKAYTEHFGLDHGEIVGKSIEEIHGDKAEYIMKNLQHTIDTGNQVRVQPRINDPKGTNGIQYVDALHSPYYDSDGNVIGVIVSARDITSFKEEEWKLEKKMNYYKSLFNHSPDLLASVNIKTGIIIKCNRTLEKVLGYKSTELNGKHVFDLHLEKHNANLALAIATLKRGERINGLKLSLISLTGETVDANLRTTPLVDMGDSVAIFVWRDVRHQNKLAYKASHDELTKLLNRSGFIEELEKPFGRANFRTISYIDVDNFKLLNDTYGHYKGDEFLQLLANILSKNLRKDDSICRIGGDEFAILVNDIALLSIEAIMQKILDQISVLVKQTAEYRDSKLGISIGIAELDFGKTANEALQRADNACCESKRRGKNRITLSTEREKYRDSRYGSQSKVINLRLRSHMAQGVVEK